MHGSWSGVEEVGEGYAVLCSHLMPDHNLVDVVKLVPILII